MEKDKKKKKAVAPAPAKLSKEEMVAALTVLQGSTGWGIVLKVLHENEHDLKESILIGEDSEGVELTKKQVNRLRDKRGYLQELMNTPAGLIETINNMEEGEEINHDPYEK